MALFLLAKSERIKMDNKNVFDFEKRWVKDLGLPEEVAHRIANIADLFEMISDQRLIPFKQHPGWFEGLQSIHRLNFDDDQIYLEALYDNNGMPPMTYDDEDNWIIPDPDKGQGRWEKYGQFYCSTDADGEIYVNYFNFLDVSDLVKLEQKEKAVLNCAKMSQVRNLKLKDIQNALYQYLRRQDPEQTFDYLNQSDNALCEELVKIDERLDMNSLSGDFLWDTVLQLFKDEKLGDSFPEYDAIGYFEGNNALQSLEWHEKAHFGKVVRYEEYGYVDLPVLEIDKSNPEYQAYRNEMYQLVTQNACKDDDLSVYLINHLSGDKLDQVTDFIKEFKRNGVDPNNDLFSKAGWRSQEDEDYLKVNDMPVIDDER